MTRSSRGRGRSPELQQLLDEAVGASMFPVQRMIPGQRGARADHYFVALPQQRGSADRGPQRPDYVRLSIEPVLDDVGSAATRTSRRRIALRSGDHPALRTPPRSKRRRTARPLHLRVVTMRLARRPTRAAWGPAASRKPRLRQQRGPLPLVVRSLGSARPRDGRALPSEQPQNRLALNVRALNIRTLGIAPVDLRELDTRTAVVRDLEVRPLQPPVVPTEPGMAGTDIAGTDIADTDSRGFPRLETTAPLTALPMAPPVPPVRPAGAAGHDDEPDGHNLPPRQSHRPRAVLLAGGVAAAVIAIVAAVVFAVGQRSGTAPDAKGSGSGGTGSSSTVARPTAAAAARAAATAKAAAPRDVGGTPTGAGATQVTTPLATPETTPRSEAAAGAPTNNAGMVGVPAAEPSATTDQTPTGAPGATDNPAPAGNGNTATVVTGISKLTGWVVLSTPSNR